jgi:hypothetical protein
LTQTPVNPFGQSRMRNEVNALWVASLTATQLRFVMMTNWTLTKTKAPLGAGLSCRVAALTTVKCCSRILSPFELRHHLQQKGARNGERPAHGVKKQAPRGGGRAGLFGIPAVAIAGVKLS